MKKTFLLLALLLAAGAIGFAQQNSNTYMPLVQSAQFTNRVQYIIAQEANAIITTEASGACHAVRASLATQVAKGPSSYAPVFAVFLATNINVTSAGALTGSGATLDTPATDAALLAAVNVIWSTIAGCITNP